MPALLGVVGQVCHWYPEVRDQQFNRNRAESVMSLSDDTKAYS